MDERDRKVFDAAKAWIEDDTNVCRAPRTIAELINIIDRLNTQLAELKEAGELFKEFYDYARPKDDEILIRYYKRSEGEIMVDQYGRTIYGNNLRRLTKALDKINEVEDEKAENKTRL